jgi:hypothetical protein
VTCSVESLLAAEGLRGTATHTSFVLVVEQPGPYAGREAALSSALPVDVGTALLSAVNSRGGKLLLTRSRDRHRVRSPDSRRVWWFWPDYPRPVVWTAHVNDVNELPKLCGGNPDTAPVDYAERIDRPVLLVCTHGRRDVCCARSGKQLLATPDDLQAEVWESSHQGGHRFAPVVLELSTGYQHGRVSREDLVTIAHEAARGRVHLRTARGHVGLAADLQAVDLAVRDRFNHFDLDGLRLVDEGGHIAVSTDSGQTIRATVHTTESTSRPESCGSEPVPARDLHVDLVVD